MYRILCNAINKTECSMIGNGTCSELSKQLNNVNEELQCTDIEFASWSLIRDRQMDGLTDELAEYNKRERE